MKCVADEGTWRLVIDEKTTRVLFYRSKHYIPLRKFISQNDTQCIAFCVPFCVYVESTFPKHLHRVDWRRNRKR